jgi:hypothetical protein
MTVAFGFVAALVGLVWGFESQGEKLDSWHLSSVTVRMCGVRSFP